MLDFRGFFSSEFTTNSWKRKCAKIESIACAIVCFSLVMVLLYRFDGDTSSTENSLVSSPYAPLHVEVPVVESSPFHSVHSSSSLPPDSESAAVHWSTILTQFAGALEIVRYWCDQGYRPYPSIGLQQAGSQLAGFLVSRVSLPACIVLTLHHHACQWPLKVGLLSNDN
jgi:hypothetical protein